MTDWNGELQGPSSPSTKVGKKGLSVRPGMQWDNACISLTLRGSGRGS